MNEKFFDLKSDKQDKMINAALHMFADNGYKHARNSQAWSIAQLPLYV